MQSIDRDGVWVIRELTGDPKLDESPKAIFEVMGSDDELVTPLFTSRDLAEDRLRRLGEEFVEKFGESQVAIRMSIDFIPSRDALVAIARELAIAGRRLVSLDDDRIVSIEDLIE